MKESINVAIIGCGMRARDVVSIFCRQLGDKLKIKAVSGSKNGLACARAALAADESARTNRIVSLSEFE